ncbi:MAG: preprotein translocase subunit YajC [Verrucomicrobia bacterium]|jgi:preprotein translocase subunit YajC|nr:preprotein translocase subunit YajC [Verrucomicrobiota bacterium]
MMIPLFQILADATSPAAPAGKAPDLMNMVVMMGGFAVLMWVLMIRPQRKKEKELLARISALKTGDRVVTIGGVHGVVSNVKDGPTLTLKVDDNCKITVDKTAVVTVLPKESNNAA